MTGVPEGAVEVIFHDDPPVRIGATKASGIARIARERVRQAEVEGWTPDHDAQHREGELARAAVVYALGSALQVREANGGRRYDPRLDIPPTTFWPWEDAWWKPVHDDPIRNLEKAGALIAAEIDRLLALKAETDG